FPYTTLFRSGHDRAGHQAYVRGALRGGAQEDDRVGAGAAVGLEVVLDDADGGEAELVGALGQVQALREVLRARFLLGQERREEIDAEPHGAPPRRCSRSLLVYDRLGAPPRPASGSVARPAAGAIGSASSLHADRGTAAILPPSAAGRHRPPRLIQHHPRGVGRLVAAPGDVAIR